MTISSTRTEDILVDELGTRALQLANITTSGQTPQPHQLGQARQFLDLVLKELQTHGEFARQVTFETQLMTIGTYKYPMNANAIDIVGDAMYIPASQTDLEKAAGETLVIEQTRDEWQRNSSKDATGQPSLYFVNRALTPIELWLWPIPEEAGTIRYQKHILIANVLEGGATIDLKQYWHMYLLYRLAELLAEGAGMERPKISALHKYAGQYLKTAKNRASQGISLQLQVTHRAGRRRGR